MKAGAELLAERGYEGFTLPEVGRRAGVSNGGMYWRVDSKETLFTAIHEQFLTRVTAGIDAFYAREDIAQMELDELIEAVVRHTADSVDRERCLLRAFVLRSGSDRETAARAAVVSRHHAASLQALLAPRLRAVGHADSEAAVAFAYSVVFNTLITRMTWPEQYLPPHPSWDELVTRLSHLIRADLLGDLREKSGGRRPSARRARAT
ncbi:TetR/AcrR family transcriptional regulator [Streptomyces sp. DG2A-72]|uniref:TetR/AcrR family transcriptional regulator n=1 Tax=Streptomyces sp. DG2A-72 TaxID=3051386 RepID=UPI00265C4DB9|nr:TetR/AcrR family transcriptional regulator [Streptomyces sp. DG2A-72]MDO0932259.1 TetR/AcrR family transcriptional regulator [Streptomyces sp. DG2A-72]